MWEDERAGGRVDVHRADVQRRLPLLILHVAIRAMIDQYSHDGLRERRFPSANESPLPIDRSSYRTVALARVEERREQLIVLGVDERFSCAQRVTGGHAVEKRAEMQRGDTIGVLRRI